LVHTVHRVMIRRQKMGSS